MKSHFNPAFAMNAASAAWNAAKAFVAQRMDEVVDRIFSPSERSFQLLVQQLAHNGYSLQGYENSAFQMTLMSARPDIENDWFLFTRYEDKHWYPYRNEETICVGRCVKRDEKACELLIAIESVSSDFSLAAGEHGFVKSTSVTEKKFILATAHEYKEQKDVASALIRIIGAPSPALAQKIDRTLTLTRA